MWIYRKGSDTNPRQLINITDIAAIQSEVDRAFGSGEGQRLYHVVVYYKTDDFLHQTHSYMKLADSQTKEKADALVDSLYEAMRRGDMVFDLSDYATVSNAPPSAGEARGATSQPYAPVPLAHGMRDRPDSASPGG